MKKKYILIAVSAVALIACTAVASSYLTKQSITTSSETSANSNLPASMKNAGTATKSITTRSNSVANSGMPWKNSSATTTHASTQTANYNNIQPAAGNQAQPQQVQQQAAPCDDKNIVGTVIGGAAGGLLGNQLGKGKGNAVATIGGAVGGAYLGNQYVPTRGVACR